MQIIINRCAVVMSDKSEAARIKWITAFVITMINISVFIIWVPAHQPGTSPMQVPAYQIILENRWLTWSISWKRINIVWDRMEKVIILLIDATLNWYFVRVVNRRLVHQGLTKYDKLVKFNVRIIMVSLAMDVSTIASSPKSFSKGTQS